MASLRSLAITLLRLDGHASIAAANRRYARDPQRTLQLLQAAWDVFAGSRTDGPATAAPAILYVAVLIASGSRFGAVLSRAPGPAVAVALGAHRQALMSGFRQRLHGGVHTIGSANGQEPR